MAMLWRCNLFLPSLDAPELQTLSSAQFRFLASSHARGIVKDQGQSEGMIKMDRKALADIHHGWEQGIIVYLCCYSTN